MGKQGRGDEGRPEKAVRGLESIFGFMDPDSRLIRAHKWKNMINMAVLVLLFAGYSLTFLVPKFYGATDRYVGVFVFFSLLILFFNNLDIKLIFRYRSRDFILLSVLLFLTLINLIIVRSGFGAFFVAADFILIFFLSGYIVLEERYLYILSGMYMLLLLLWFIVFYPKLFADFAYYGYNTNTAATFTVYTLLLSFILPELLKDRLPGKLLKRYPELPGFFMTLLMIKGLQLSFWHRARGAFVMLIMFMVFRFVIPKSLWQKRGFYSFIWIFATFGSLMFVALYIMISHTGVNFRLPFFYKSVFSGRELIWKEFFDLFAKKPLTGIGTNVVIESFFEFNVHNAMYNFLVIHGAVVFAGILVLVFSRARYFGRAAVKSRISLSALIILISVFVESFFDVDLIWVDYSLNLLCLMIFIDPGRVYNGEI